MFYILLVSLLLSNSFLFEAIATISILEKGVVPLERNSLAIQFYVDIVNEDRFSTCGLNSWTKQCCFADSYDENHLSHSNCDALCVYGSNRHTIKPRDRDTIVWVYPTLIPYDQIGTCNFVIDYNCGIRRLSKREEVDIKFDTRLKANKNILKEVVKVKTCDTLDLDSLNTCDPVDCNMKYLGTKPYFDGRISKCVDAQVCETDPNADLPDIVYDPKSNTCKDLDNPLSIADIYSISSGLGVVTESTNNSGVNVQVKTNCTTISHNLQLLRDMMYGKLYPIPNDVNLDYSYDCKSAFFKITIYILGLCALLLCLVLCIHTSVWVHKKWLKGDLKNYLGKIKRKCMKTKLPQCTSNKSRVNKEVKNKLLRDVIVTDLPIELRDSVADLCERVNREIKWKRRYRMCNIESQVKLVEQLTYASSRTSSTTTLQEENGN